MSDREPTADELIKTLSESIADLQNGEVSAADTTGLITDFDTPRNGNLGDVHADSALEEPRRATK